MSQLIQLPGAALILLAFVSAQIGWLDSKSRWYLWPNAVGSAALALNAAYFRQWGFLLLEGSWAIVSLIGLLCARSAGKPRPAVLAGEPCIEGDDRDVALS